MERSKTTQVSPTHGQAAAATGILLLLAITVPVLGILMIPVTALAAMGRELGEAAKGLPRGWTARS